MTTKDEKQEEDNIYESKKPKQIEKPKRKKQGITKSIKMFCIFLLFVIVLVYKMQKAISNKIQLGETLNPLKNYAGVPFINDEETLWNLFQKVDNVGEFCKEGKGNGDLSRYFPNVLPKSRQSQITSELPRTSYASVIYSDKKQLEFVLDFTANTYSNYSSMEICLPIQFYSKTKTKLDNMMTVNNFFGHWFTDIDIRRYPDDKRTLPTNNSLDIYQYSNAQLKYLPEKSVKTFENNVVF